MKHIYPLLLILLSLPTFAQWETIQVNTADTLTDIEYADGRYFVAGKDSVFLRSDDNGASFNILSDYNWNNPYEKRINNISFYDSLSGIASMKLFGPILTTADGGVTWANYENSEYYYTTAAETINDSTLFIFKGSAALGLDTNLTLRAENSVDIFVDTLLAPLYNYYPPEHFTEGNIGTWGWILRSDDRGETITMGSFPYSPGYVDYAFVVNKDTLCFTNYGGIGVYFSYDGGITWVRKERPEVDWDIVNIEGKGILYFNDQMHGFISKYDGKFYKTIDAGDTWQQVPSVESTGLNDITFVNDLEGYLVGNSGLVMSTIDGGMTWNQENSGTTHALNAIDFNDENIIAVGDSGTIVKRLRNALSGLSITSQSGEFDITVEGGTLQLQAYPLPADSDNPAVSWSVENLSGEGIISQDGLLTAINNGVVLARATSQANPAVYGEMAIIITNQPDTSPLGADTTVCLGEPLTLNASRPNSTYLWQDGSTDSVFTATEGNMFWVTVTNEISTVTDTIYVEFMAPPVVDLGPDTSICEGDNLVLDASGTNADLLWQDGSSEAEFLVTQAGVYWVLAENEACTFSDTIQVSVIPLPEVSLGSDTVICEGDTLVLDASGTNADFLWQDGSTEAEFLVTQAGVYWVLAENEACSFSDTIQVSVIPLPEVNLGSDTLLCEGQTLVLQATQSNATYIWQDGSTASSFTVQGEGIYSVEITVNGCSASDSITVAYTICTGIKEKEGTSIVRAYPNPTSNKLYVQLDKTYSNIHIAVSDAKGTQVKSVSMKQSNKLELDLSSLPSGMYVITIQADGVVSSIKVQKE